MLFIISILLLLICIYFLNYLSRKRVSFSKRVFLALFLAVVVGLILHNFYPKELLGIVKDWYNIVGKGYVALLKMITMPLIIVSILSAIVNISDGSKATKMGGLIIAVLLITAAIASVVSEIVSIAFKLNANLIVSGTREVKAGQAFLSKVSRVESSISEKVISFIPQNPFLDMTAARSTSIIAIVIFCIFFGMAVLKIKKKKEESARIIISGINALNDVVMYMVKMVIRLTPYGVFALMANVIATTNLEEIYRLIQFVLASYVAIIIMYIIHLIIISFTGLSPITYMKKTWALMLFAFSSRTSAGSLPINIETQENLGVAPVIANMAATFGVSIGQNGCAAIYPTMLAIMIAPTLGINVLSFAFLAKVVFIVTISSLGVAGVGGGATFAAIIVLTGLNFPVELAGLLISVEPLIDMGRTALNVNDSIVAGIVSSKILKNFDKEQFNKLNKE